MKEFCNKGWDNLHKMEEIFPTGGATGVGSHHGTALNRAYEGSPQSLASALGAAASYSTNDPGVGLSKMDQQAVIVAANMVSMVVWSLTDISPLILPIPANLSVTPKSYSSHNNKCPLSSLLHKDMESDPHPLYFRLLMHLYQHYLQHCRFLQNAPKLQHKPKPQGSQI